MFVLRAGLFDRMDLLEDDRFIDATFETDSCTVSERMFLDHRGSSDVGVTIPTPREPDYTYYHGVRI